jgi:hypothetical protein
MRKDSVAEKQRISFLKIPEKKNSGEVDKIKQIRSREKKPGVQIARLFFILLF